jgi:hypothetical protein
MSIYTKAVWDCTGCVLKNTTDVLAAFSAVLSFLRPHFRADFLCGLPSSELELALPWTPRTAAKRRLDPLTGKPLFPTFRKLDPISVG